MNPEPPPPPRHYAWPKYVLAALALFLFVCVTWTIREVNKVRKIQQDNSPARATAPVTPRHTTNNAVSTNR
jgi:hypothetical protein